MTPAVLTLLAALWAQPPGRATVGRGVSCRDTGRTRVYGTFIAYGGWGVKETWARAWVDEVYRTALARRGIRYLCAVRGPADVDYAGREIGNSALAEHLLARPRGLVVVAAHSSGSFVAHELFGELEAMGPRGTALLGRTVYYDLDGGESGLTPDIVSHLRRAYFVYADDSTTSTRSANAATMIALGTQHADKGGVLEVNAARSGCKAGAKWCLHDALVTERPHNPETFDLEKDYQASCPTVPRRWPTWPLRGTHPPSSPRRPPLPDRGPGTLDYCGGGARPSSWARNRWTSWFPGSNSANRRAAGKATSRWPDAAAIDASP